MANYEVELTEFASREIRRLQPADRKKIFKILPEFETYPFRNSKKLAHQSDMLWRRKVGRDLRIIFSARDRTIRILAPRYRSDKTYSDLDKLARI